MTQNTVVSPFLGSFMTAIFIFSTIYTVAYLYALGSGQQLNTEGLPDNANNPTGINATSNGIFGFIMSPADGVLEFISWVSPFALVKLIILEVTKSTPEIYLIFNLLILRPVGWITALFTANYIISRIPTEHGE